MRPPPASLRTLLNKGTANSEHISTPLELITKGSNVNVAEAPDSAPDEGLATATTNQVAKKPAVVSNFKIFKNNYSSYIQKRFSYNPYDRPTVSQTKKRENRLKWIL